MPRIHLFNTNSDTAPFEMRTCFKKKLDTGIQHTQYLVTNSFAHTHSFNNFFKRLMYTAVYVISSAQRMFLNTCHVNTKHVYAK